MKNPDEINFADIFMYVLYGNENDFYDQFLDILCKV